MTTFELPPPPVEPEEFIRARLDMSPLELLKERDQQWNKMCEEFGAMIGKRIDAVEKTLEAAIAERDARDERLRHLLAAFGIKLPGNA